MKQLFEAYQPSELVQTHRIINTPSDIAKHSLFYVQETGYLKSLKTHRSERSRLTSYLFLIVISGKGTFSYKERNYELTPNDCVFIDCMEHYTHQSDESDHWELMWVHFHGESVKDYYAHFIQNGDNVFHTNVSK